MFHILERVSTRGPTVNRTATKSSIRQAKRIWGPLSESDVASLRELLVRYRLSVGAGHLQFLQNGWYITHAGLLNIAQRRGCTGISVHQVREFCDPANCHWTFRATVYKRNNARGFAGYGDADPSNISRWMHGAEMRIAETRAVNRALRKAYGIGLCSVEELGLSPTSAETRQSTQASSFNRGDNGHHDGQTRLRDQLCFLIRQYNLDPRLVKAYAAHFCGTETIKEASRDLVESFISHLAASAKEDLDGLICKLNFFAQPREVQQ